MKFAPLVLKHLRKNWIRTLSTVLAMAVCIFLICTLQTVVDAVNYALSTGNASRLVTRHYVSLVFNLPSLTKPASLQFPALRTSPSSAGLAASIAIPSISFPTSPSSRRNFSRSIPRSCCQRIRSRPGSTTGAVASSAGAWRTNGVGSRGHLPDGELYSSLSCRPAFRLRG